MKSKKIVALALTAALTVSAASMTAFAGEFKVTKGDNSYTVTFTKEELTPEGSESDGNVKGIDITVEMIKGADGYEEPEHPDNPTTIKFNGWKVGDVFVSDVSDVNGDKDLSLEDLEKGETVVGTDSSGDDALEEVVLKLTPQWTNRTDKEVNEYLEQKKKEEDAAKYAADREAHLKEEDKNHNATDNVNTGSGVETKPANVDRKTDPIDPSATDTSEYHDLQAAGVNVGANELAWVYEVTAPEKFMSSTKNARVQLTLPEGYTTSNYKVTVYHVKGWCSKQKVTGLDVGTYDVAFWANDFSPYVLILTPKGATSTGTSTNNPGTGDFSAVPVALLAAAALGATGFVAYKKRKAE